METYKTDRTGILQQNSHGFFISPFSAPEKGALNLSFGYGSIKSNYGYSALIGGVSNKIEANTYGSVIIGGYNNLLNCMESFIFGTSNQVYTLSGTNRNNIALGRKNLIHGGNSNILAGTALEAEGQSTFIAGQANVYINGNESVGNDPECPRFIVGNGTITNSFSASVRKNAFVVLHKGLVTADSLTNELIENSDNEFVIITKKYLQENYSKKGTFVSKGTYENILEANNGGLVGGDVFNSADGTLKVMPPSDDGSLGDSGATGIQG